MVMREDLKEKVIEILAEFTELNKENIEEHTSLIADMDLNSLDVINVVVAFEEEFDIDIPDRIISDFVTVKNIMEYLEQQV